MLKEWVLSLAYATQAWVQSQGYLTTSYVHNPPTAGWDFHEADFIEDGTWRTIDLSAIIPVGTKAVHFVGRFENTTVGKGFHFSTPGNIATVRYQSGYIQVAMIRKGMVFIITPNEDREISYFFSAGGWIQDRINILGWWL